MTGNGYTCRICGKPLTGQQRKLCASRDCTNTARHEQRARFRPGGARGQTGRPVLYYRVIKDNPNWPTGKVFAAALIRADIRAGEVERDCFAPWEDKRAQAQV